MLRNFVIQEADVAAALRALAGLGLGNRLVGMAAGETAYFARWFGRIEEPHQERARRLDRRPSPQKRLAVNRLRRRFRLRIRILAGFCKARDWSVPYNSLALADLKVGTAGPALGRDDKCGFDLDVPAFGARHIDAMALGLIGHGKAAVGGSVGNP